MRQQNSTYPLRMPKSLKSAVAKICEEEGTSINQFVNMAIAEKISVMQTAAFFAERAAGADLDAARRVINREGGMEPDPQDRLDQGTAPEGEMENNPDLTPKM